jgi:hypothetical protein
VIKRSDARPAVIADSTPTRIPNVSQMNAAPIASENVAGTPSLIWFTTLTPWCVCSYRLFVNAFFIMS